MGIYVDPNSANYNGFYGYPGQMDPGGYYGIPSQGTGPYVNANRPGFFSGAWGLVSPFSHTPLHQSPGDEAAPYYNAVGTRPFDAAASFAQNYLVPGLAVGASMKLLGANTGSFFGDIMAPFRGQGAAAAFGKGMGTGMSSRIMSGLNLPGNAARMMSGMGFSSTGMISRGVVGAAGLASRGAIGAAGAIGGAVAGFGIPLIVAEGLSRVANYSVFDPYIATRTIAGNLKENLYGVTMPGAEGDITRGGKGLGSSEATRMAQQITRAGIKDYSLDLDQYGDVANMLGKSGALDSVSAKRIVDRIKSASEQVKLIVQISKDPSLQKAVEELSKLQLAGASLDGGRLGIAGQTYSQLGMYASAAGTTVQRMMAGVGAQGQSMYGSMGMTGYMGQLAAGNIYSGFAAAYRSGLVSEGMMNRMGGIDNATRIAMAGGLTAAQSPLMQMMMYNTAAGARGAAAFGGSQTPVGVASVFGQMAAEDPLSVMGNQMLLGPQMTERFMQNDSRHIEETTIGTMRSMGIQPAGNNGKYTIQQMAPFMQSLFGMDPEQIRAFANRRMAETNAATVAGKNKGLQTQAYEETLQYAESQGLVNTMPGRASHAVRSAAKGFRGAVNAYVAEPLSSMAGSFQTTVAEAVHGLQYGNTLATAKEMTVADLAGNRGLKELGWREVKPQGFGGNVGETTEFLAPYKGFDLEKGFGGANFEALFSTNTSNPEIRKILMSIQGLAQNSGHPAQELAAKFMSTSNRSERGALLSDLLRKFPDEFPEGAYDRLFKQSEDYNIVLDQALAGQVADIRVRQDEAYNQRSLTRSVEDILGGKAESAFSGMQSMGKVLDIVNRMGPGGDLDAATLDRAIESDPDLKRLVGNKRGKAAEEHLLGIANRLRGSGMYTQAAFAGKFGDVMKMDPSLIKDKVYQDKFKAETTRAGKERVMSAYTASVVKPGIAISQGRSYSWSENAALMKPSLTAGGKAAAGLEDIASSMADYSQYSGLVKAFEVPIKAFNDGVVKFSEAVGKMPGASSDGGKVDGMFRLRNEGNSLLDRGLKNLKGLGAER